jgi:hypothetical protein
MDTINKYEQKQSEDNLFLKLINKEDVLLMLGLSPGNSTKEREITLEAIKMYPAILEKKANQIAKAKNIVY